MRPVDKLTELRELRERAVLGGGRKRIEDQHARGKMTARERLALLLDEGSFQELGALATHNSIEFGLADRRTPGDGVVCGFGKIGGRRVAVFAHDFTVLGGSFSAVQSQKICRITDLAMESGIPLVGLNDSGGARIQIPLVGMLMLGNLMRESGVVERLTGASSREIANTVTLFLGLAVGSTMRADAFLRASTLQILLLGVFAFALDTVAGLLFAKGLNAASGGRFNPLIGAAGISAFPMAARVVNRVGLEEDFDNFLLMHAMGANTAGQIASVVAGGVLLALLGPR